MIALLFVTGIALLALGYFLYGGLVERWLGVDDSRPTPAHVVTEDPDAAADAKYDYSPARAPVLFGHHFSSIAGAGPIAGPIFAAALFGWLPVALWIVLGAVLIGGVQDFSALVASLRHQARSIGEISRQFLSPLGFHLLLIFIYLTLLYVTVVFLDLTSRTFVASGGVASSSVLYIVLAAAFGLLVLRCGMSLWLGSLIFVPLVFLGIWGGQELPLVVGRTAVGDAGTFWDLVLIGYCFVASVLPVWLLLQPRDYLSSYLLFGCLAGGLVGIVVGAITGDLGAARVDAFTGFNHPAVGSLIPVLFITVACGASSGFHTLVASGTTAKQLDRERHARPIAFGGMLLEGVLALVALTAIVVVGSGSGKVSPTVVFANGMGRFLGALGIDPKLGAAFGLLAVSTFLLTTLDTCTRLGRYVFEELTRMQGWTARYLATAVTVGIPAVFVLVPFQDAQGRPIVPWKVIWPVFGATNQLLGGLAMLVVILWLRSRGRRAWFVILPCAFMVTVTIWSLAQMVFGAKAAPVIRIVAGILLLLALALVAEAALAFRRGMRKDVALENDR
ncbi:MAG: carbon starvation CstA family protein [bacterium]